MCTTIPANRVLRFLTVDSTCERGPLGEIFHFLYDNVFPADTAEEESMVGLAKRLVKGLEGAPIQDGFHDLSCGHSGLQFEVDGRLVVELAVVPPVTTSSRCTRRFISAARSEMLVTDPPRYTSFMHLLLVAGGRDKSHVQWNPTITLSVIKRPGRNRLCSSGNMPFCSQYSLMRPATSFRRTLAVCTAR